MSTEFELKDVYYNKKLVTLVLGSDYVKIINNDVERIEKDAIQNFEMFLSTKAYNLRINTENLIYDFNNVHESQIAPLKRFINNFSSFTMLDLEFKNCTEGNLRYGNQKIVFENDNIIFSIPKSKIQSVTQVETEVGIKLDNTEIIFDTSSSVTSFLTNKISNEIAIIKDINCVYPRSKCSIIFYKNYFMMKGQSYEHTIFYNQVQSLFSLSYDSDGQYIVIGLETPIRQGRTKYASLVYQVDKSQCEIVCEDSRLKNTYSGRRSDCFLDILDALVRPTPIISETSYNCYYNINNGNLYLLEDSILFLTKVFNIPVKDISAVEFYRADVSIGASRTFDMCVVADKRYTFSQLPKFSFSEFENYFASKNIELRNCVIEDEYSESTEQSESADISSFIESD